MESDVVLPNFEADQFRLTDPPECDAIMKGGITSGIVYPYAILEIATKYRFRSLGGTSVGAIAAAFAAAAEYGRANGRPEAFLAFKRYGDSLPEVMPSLFQPAPAMKQVFDDAKSVIAKGSAWPLVRKAALRAFALAAVPAALIGWALAAWGKPMLAAVMAALLALVLIFAAAFLLGAKRRYLAPLGALAGQDFGFCPGLTQPGHDGPALTDWVHGAIQDIAFGDPHHTPPLTFGDLAGAPGGHPIELKVVTTNLSMRRPHTLPKLGVVAGFLPDRWRTLFPKPVMDHLLSVCEPWKQYPARPQALRFPLEDSLPVVVAVRMSLSFPLLFRTVPLEIRDVERSKVVSSLGGGKAEIMIRTVHFSDGGISSNFPIHMFDSPFPRRPTFAFSLEDLLADESKVKHRVALPAKASDGMGVQIIQIENVARFLWQIVSSAKDWQDQLLSEMSGQRERIAKVYLTSKEGGLNLEMDPTLSRRLMAWGYEAGKKFTGGDFDFDEHRWRRLLAVYRNLRLFLGHAEDGWAESFKAWYLGYYQSVRSYKEVTPTDRRRMAEELDALLACAEMLRRPKPIDDQKFPRRTGALKYVPTY